MDRSFDAWRRCRSPHGELLGRRTFGAIRVSSRHDRPQHNAPGRNHPRRLDVRASPHRPSRFPAHPRGAQPPLRLPPSACRGSRFPSVKTPSVQDSRASAYLRLKLRRPQSAVADLPRRAPDPVRAPRARQRIGWCRHLPAHGPPAAIRPATSHPQGLFRVDLRASGAQVAPARPVADRPRAAAPLVPLARAVVPTPAALGRPGLRVASRPPAAAEPPSPRRRA